MSKVNTGESYSGSGEEMIALMVWRNFCSCSDVGGNCSSDTKAAKGGDVFNSCGSQDWGGSFST
eukprot:scaffold369468_cov59-Attheya_sp.AAC.1